jgi:hypothetical protein
MDRTVEKAKKDSGSSSTGRAGVTFADEFCQRISFDRRDRFRIPDRNSRKVASRQQGHLSV